MTKTKKFLVSKNEKKYFYSFFRKKTSNIISKLNDDFSEAYFEVYNLGDNTKSLFF
jgi:hypothetical protein